MQGGSRRWPALSSADSTADRPPPGGKATVRIGRHIDTRRRPQAQATRPGAPRRALPGPRRPQRPCRPCSATSPSPSASATAPRLRAASSSRRSCCSCSRSAMSPWRASSPRRAAFTASSATGSAGRSAWLPAGPAWPPTRCSKQVSGASSPTTRAARSAQFLHINLPGRSTPSPVWRSSAVLTYFDVKLSARSWASPCVLRCSCCLSWTSSSSAKGGGPSGISFAPLNPGIGALSRRQHQGGRARGRHLLRPVVVGRLRVHGQLC